MGKFISLALIFFLSAVFSSSPPSVYNSAGSTVSMHMTEISVPVPRVIPIDDINGSLVKNPTKNAATVIIVPDVIIVGNDAEIASVTAVSRCIVAESCLNLLVMRMA